MKPVVKEIGALLNCLKPRRSALNLCSARSSMTMASNDQPGVPRGVFSRLPDRMLAWLIGFPPERCNYTTQSLRIPISDGLLRIELAADLLQPSLNGTLKPLGTILFSSPYGRGLPIAITPRAYAARGYQVLVVSSRGTFGSGGEFDPFRTEVQDGKGVVEWMRNQSWYTGTFATCGGSYLGYVQWALLCDPPKDLIAAVPAVSPHNFARSWLGTGANVLDKRVGQASESDTPPSLRTCSSVQHHHTIS
jgi:predicted acyl esterase